MDSQDPSRRWSAKMTLFITVHKRQSPGAAGILHLSCGQTCQSSGSTTQVREAGSWCLFHQQYRASSSPPGRGARSESQKAVGRIHCILSLCCGGKDDKAFTFSCCGIFRESDIGKSIHRGMSDVWVRHRGPAKTPAPRNGGQISSSSDGVQNPFLLTVKWGCSFAAGLSKRVAGTPVNYFSFYDFLSPWHTCMH